MSYIGTVSGWLTFVTIVSLGWIMIRGGSGTAVTGLQNTNRELNRQIHEKEGTIKALERINAELRAQKDVTSAIVPVLEAMVQHERRAAERHDGLLKIMDLVAQRLGSEPNGG